MAELLTDDRTRGFTKDDVSEARYSELDDDGVESQGMAIRSIPSGSRVLDVGCGTGEFASALTDRLKCDVLCVEPHQGRAERARVRGLAVVNGYLTAELVSAEPPFDVVTFMDVLEHTPDPVELLMLGASAVKPGGIIILSVPNVAHWTVRLRLLAGRFDYRPSGIMDATHLRWFTARTIGEVVRSAHLEIVRQDVSRGLWMRAYREGIVGRHLSPERRRRIVDSLCKKLPSLFGCQHFVVATKH